MPDTSHERHRVVIAGGGIAGLEALLSLTGDAPAHVDVTLASTDAEFRLRALSVNEPFAAPTGRTWQIEPLCVARCATFVHATVAGIRHQDRVVALADGKELAYDSLLVATGAASTAPFDGGTLFRGMRDAESVHGIVQDVEAGYTSDVALVVPAGITWPLPIYELALMLAERAYSMNMDRVRITLVTAEAAPLDVFGDAAADMVRGCLGEAGIRLRTATQVTGVVGGAVLREGGEAVVQAQRVVVAPRLSGQALDGLPADRNGFIPVDVHGRVRGMDGAWAAGDGTTCPIKQGGVAAQLAEAACSDIARRAGADVPLREFHPVLRAELLTGGRPVFLRHALGEIAGAGEHPPWWPPAKVAAPRLTGWLVGADLGAASACHARRPRVLHATGDPAGGVELLR